MVAVCQWGINLSWSIISHFSWWCQHICCPCLWIHKLCQVLFSSYFWMVSSCPPDPETLMVDWLLIPQSPQCVVPDTPYRTNIQVDPAASNQGLFRLNQQINSFGPSRSCIQSSQFKVEDELQIAVEMLTIKTRTPKNIGQYSNQNSSLRNFKMNYLNIYILWYFYNETYWITKFMDLNILF